MQEEMINLNDPKSYPQTTKQRMFRKLSYIHVTFPTSTRSLVNTNQITIT